MRDGKRLVFISVLVAVMCMVLTPPGHCMKLNTDVQGELHFNYVLRDTNGFEDSFMDETKGVQARTQLKLDVNLIPVYDIEPNLKLDKVFFRFRCWYDAIYELTDRYDNLPEDRSTSSDYDLDRDDLHYNVDLFEAYADIDWDVNGWYSNLRLGRQIIQWGEAGLFNVVNVVNPQDLSMLRNFDNPEDLAMPIWMGRLDVTTPAVGIFNELNFQVCYIPDNRPSVFGIDMAPGVASPYSLADGAFGETRQNDHSSKLNDPQWALRAGFSAASLRAYFYYYDGYMNGPAINLVQGALDGTGFTYLDHPEQDVYGASFNYDFGKWVLRGEAAYTDETYLLDLTDLFVTNFTGYQGYKRYEYLLGTDTSFFATYGFPGAGGSPLSASFELYYRETDDYDFDQNLRPVSEEDQWRATYAFNTFFFHGSLLVVYAGIYDDAGDGCLLQVLSGEYTPDGRMYCKIAVSATFGDDTAPSDFAPLIGSSEIAFRIGYRF